MPAKLSWEEIVQGFQDKIQSKKHEVEKLAEERRKKMREKKEQISRENSEKINKPKIVKKGSVGS